MQSLIRLLLVLLHRFSKTAENEEEEKEPALVEGVYLDAVVRVLLQDLLGVLVCVEGIHEDQRHVCVVPFVQVLQGKKKKMINKKKKRWKKVLVAVRLLRKRSDGCVTFKLLSSITFWYMSMLHILITSNATLPCFPITPAGWRLLR